MLLSLHYVDARIEFRTKLSFADEQMKFTIAAADLEMLLKGAGLSRPKKDDTFTLFACAARIFVEFKGDVAGIEGIVLADGGVTLRAQNFSKVLKTFKGTLNIEGSPNELKIQGFKMPVLAWHPNPRPPADFHLFPVKDTGVQSSGKTSTRSSRMTVAAPDKGRSKSQERPHFLPPIPIPERLPQEIEPCPIVEAAIELRYVSSEPWRNLPGLLSPRLRERYPQESELPLAKIPESIRQQEANFSYQPLLQYDGPNFLIRFGPRVLTLITRTHNYPGWERFREELTWLWGEAGAAGFVQEGERLAVRYVDFFAEDIFSLVVLNVSVAGHDFPASEQSVSAILPWEDSTARLVLANGAFLNDGRETRRGSILELDVWQRLASEDVFSDASAQVEKLHAVNKKLFFGLLKPEFLATLNPVY